MKLNCCRFFHTHTTAIWSYSQRTSFFSILIVRHSYPPLSYFPSSSPTPNISVRELFRVADDLSPSIVFIDEIDAIGSKRYDSSSGKKKARFMIRVMSWHKCVTHIHNCWAERFLLEVFDFCFHFIWRWWPHILIKILTSTMTNSIPSTLTLTLPACDWIFPLLRYSSGIFFLRTTYIPLAFPYFSTYE